MTPSFSWKERRTALETLKIRTEPVELMIIGGGVVGCSLAAHAAELGLRCVLMEREDLAAGTSGHSTGLAHAGLRYLTQGHVLYVLRESRERQLLEELAPAYVHPFNFIFPVYRENSFGLGWVRFGTWIYDQLYRLTAPRLSTKHPKHYDVLTPEAILRRIPGLRQEGLEGGTEYFVDAQLSDARFTMAFAQKAAERGASILTHYEVDSVARDEKGLMHIHCHDRLSHDAISIRAKLVINTAGPWIDELRLKAGFAKPILLNSKGIHLVVDRLADTPLILASRARGQVFFVLPIDSQCSLVGTTDTSFKAPPDQAHSQREDVDELVGEILRFFPALSQGDPNDRVIRDRYKDEHVHQTFWGLRPLVRQAGLPGRQAGSTVSASRDYAVVQDSPAFWSVPGVKLTSGRLAGYTVARKAWKALRSSPVPEVQLNRLPGSECENYASYVQKEWDRWQSKQWPDDVLRYLIDTYGTRFETVLSYAQAQPRYRERVLPGRPWILAEAAYAVQHEMVLTLNDFLWRRSRWARWENLSLDRVREIARVLAEPLSWADKDVDIQLDQFKREQERHRV